MIFLQNMAAKLEFLWSQFYVQAKNLHANCSFFLKAGPLIEKSCIIKGVMKLVNFKLAEREIDRR